jgi:hypothetical protein
MLGDMPIEDRFRLQMNALAQAISEILNEDPSHPKVGFCLMMFNIGDTGRCNYISNVNRQDVVCLLKEQLAHFEGQPNIVGHA